MYVSSKKSDAKKNGTDVMGKADSNMFFFTV